MFFTREFRGYSDATDLWCLRIEPTRVLPRCVGSNISDTDLKVVLISELKKLIVDKRQ